MFLRTVARATLNLHSSELSLVFGVPCSVQRSLCPKMMPQILKSDKFAFWEKECLTIACMKEQISASSKTVQEGRGREFWGPAWVRIYRYYCVWKELAEELRQAARTVCRRLTSSDLRPCKIAMRFLKQQSRATISAFREHKGLKISLIQWLLMYSVIYLFILQLWRLQL